MEAQVFKVGAAEAGQRLDLALLGFVGGITRSHIKNLVEQQLVQVNGKTVKAGYILCAGDEISFKDQAVPALLDAAVPEKMQLDIIFEDEHMAIINKPQGMVVHPAAGNFSGTLVNGLLYHFGNNLSNYNSEQQKNYKHKQVRTKNFEKVFATGPNGEQPNELCDDFGTEDQNEQECRLRPGIVHRLDKNTSGLLVVAKTNAAHANLARQIETKTCHRYYLALLSGSPKENEGQIVTNIARSKSNRKLMSVCAPGEGRRAVTKYRIIQEFNGNNNKASVINKLGRITYAEFQLETGRTHQIRVHAKHLSCPVLCDPEYGIKSSGQAALCAKVKSLGQFLHAYKLSLNHPVTNERLEFVASLPEHFKQALTELGAKIV